MNHLDTSETCFDYVSLFAGPGGWCQGLRTLGLSGLGVELDGDACATRAAAGHATLRADITTLDPARFRHIRGLVASPPCPTYSAGGTRSGLADMQHVLDAITCIGEGCDSWQNWLPDAVTDVRSALVAHTFHWIVTMEPDWVLLEQVPALEYAWEDICAELASVGWESFDVVTLDAADFGVAQHRRRTFMLAHRYRPIRHVQPSHGDNGRPHVAPVDVLDVPADATLGFPRRNDRDDGAPYRARDLRTVTRPTFTLTGKVRSWKVHTPDQDPRPLTVGEVSTLAGFGDRYPVAGSRSSACMQLANAVAPPVAAALGAAVA